MSDYACMRAVISEQSDERPVYSQSLGQCFMSHYLRQGPSYLQRIYNLKQSHSALE